jgi:hypothetical protein
MAALSIYFVMQTMEAVIFRLLELSIPVWVVWKIAGYKKTTSLEIPADVALEAEVAVTA